MNKLLLLIYSIMVFGLASCSGASKTIESLKTIEKTDYCTADSKNTYEVFIPQRNDTTEKLPILIIIDAHGGGKFALDKFKQSAKKYHTILIASDYIKNGFVNYESAIQTLIEDVQQKYPVGKTIFMTGFSGGARMVLGYAQNHSVNGIISCGALANADQLKAINCPIISISGMDDFNFIETAQFMFQEQLIPANLKIELTNASHSWPDSIMLTNAVGFLRFASKTTENPTPKQAQCRLYCDNQLARIDSLKQKGEYIKATLIARNLSTTEPFNLNEAFAKTYNELKANSEYNNQMNQLVKGINYEIGVRQPYINDFQTKDTIWWKNEIATIDSKIKTEQDSYSRDMYKRIKSFWGIACYSLCNQAIQQQNTEMLQKILSIYRMIEPNNTDMLFFSAFPYYWKGNADATISALKKAISAGYSDMEQVKKNFPEVIISRL